MAKFSLKKLSLKNLFKKKKKFKKEKFQINPNLYWRYLLLFAAILIGAAFLFGFFVFESVKRNSLVSPDYSNEREATGQKERIIQMIEYFDDRERKRQEIISSPSAVTDPSRPGLSVNPKVDIVEDSEEVLEEESN